MFAVILENLIFCFPAMSNRGVQIGHQGDGIPWFVVRVHVGHSVLAVEGDGLFSLLDKSCRLLNWLLSAL